MELGAEASRVGAGAQPGLEPGDRAGANPEPSRAKPGWSRDGARGPSPGAEPGADPGDQAGGLSQDGAGGPSQAGVEPGG